MYMCFSQHAYLHTMCGLVAFRGWKRPWDHMGTGIMDDYELPCGIWEPIPGILEEQSVPLIVHLSLYPQL